MKVLWAPWRMQYIKKADRMACFLCAYSKSNADKKNLIVYRDKNAFSILNRYPYNSGHLMVAPYSHKGNMENLSYDEILAIFKVTNIMKRALDMAIKPHGYNIGINIGRTAGATLVEHVHLHIVPRWDGDTNFMPVLSGTKVIPISLEELHGKLRQALKKINRVSKKKQYRPK